METEKHEAKYVGSFYMAPLLDLDLFEPYLETSVKLLTTIADSFDSIAFRGMSGAIVAPILALRLRKSLILVRKAESDHHSSFGVEGNQATLRYLIADDFVCLGDTARAIKKAVKDFAPAAVCIGLFEFTSAILIDREARPLLYTDF
jgi:adenine/guanine phosphoribosyltransferase-like PRPP-binding protein